MNKFERDLKEIHTFFFQENPFENVVCEMVAILPQPQCVKHETLIVYTCIWMGTASNSETKLSVKQADISNVRWENEASLGKPAIHTVIGLPRLKMS